MNILVIGNGFDLAHGLPTTYMDFLNFIKIIQRNQRTDKISADIAIGCFKRLVQEKRLWEDSMDGIFNEEDVLKYIEALNNFAAVRNENFWMQHFIYRQGEMGERWVDFEQEISNCVTILENTDNNSRVDFSNTLPETNGKILMMKKSDVIKKLEKDLENLNKSLEMYIVLVNLLPIQINEQFKKLGKIDSIVSFNYTDTYRLYENLGDVLYKLSDGDRGEIIDFIHGKAGEGNVILGAGETLTGNAINTELSCVKFKKYFQRIHNRTGGKYREFVNGKIWNQNKSKYVANTTVSIYGHSLDVTDKDILNNIITHEFTERVIIYYYEDDEKSDYETSIINLIQVLGKEELTARVGDGRIVFKSVKELS